MRKLGQARLNSIDKSVGDRVTALLAQRGMPIESAAKLAGMSLIHFEACRSGKCRFSAKQIFELSKALNVSISEFYSDL